MKIMKLNIITYLILLLGFMAIIISCDSDELSSNSTLTLNITGLEDLGNDYIYEGWIIVDGAPITTGTFTVNGNGNLSTSAFEVENSDLESASTFVLTIEPSPDPDPAPSDIHILAGDFSGEDASLSIDHMAALNNDFKTANGKYILATPTDGADNNEDSGVWFLDNSSGSPKQGLTLPDLPNGWTYEGWVVIDETPVSTGTFNQVNAADNNAPYSGNMDGPPFPGEDFLLNAPNGLTFPTTLNGGTAVISIEPVPDNSPMPFALKPLVGMIPIDSVVHTAYNMDQNLTFPSGSVSR